MHLDYRSTEQQDKAFSTISAQLALAGFTLHKLADGTYLAGRWGFTTHPLATVEDVVTFARKAGAKL